jgi:DNA-binding transcriptional ArsR family regulator
MAGIEYIEADDVRGTALHVAIAPLLSVLTATRDAVGAQRSATPESWCSAIRVHLIRRDYEVLAPLTMAERALVPDAILQFPEPPGRPLKEALERVVASEERLMREISACLTGGPTGDWRQVVCDPQRWTRGFVMAMARAWNGFRPIWQLAQDALARERERVAVASAHGSQLELLDRVLPGGGIVDGRWRLGVWGDRDTRYGVPDDGLVMMPLVAGGRASIMSHDAATVDRVGYPLLPIPRRAPTATHPPASLEALLGIPRARILRELDRPASSSGLAQALQTVPSAATHHINALEAAGLVARDRDGRRVMVRRTPRGEALLALYDAA